MARNLPLLGILLLTTACTYRPSSVPAVRAAAVRDVAGVLAAAFAHVFPRTDGRYLAVDDRLAPDEGVFMVPFGVENYDPEAELLADVRQRLPALRLDTAEDFVRRQHDEEPLPSGMVWPSDVDLGGDDDFDGWDGFYRKHPGSLGILTFSPVGFSGDRRQALVFYSVVREGLDGSGNLVLLEQVDGAWRVVAHENVWIA